MKNALILLAGGSGRRFAKSNKLVPKQFIKCGGYNFVEYFLRNLDDKIFDLINNSNIQRPFELATLRLMNMIEVISNWNVYMNNGESLTQRSATFLIDSNYNLLYSYYSKGLLGYSENMSNPLGFLDIFI